jgi:histidinol-phosphate aminotransferase
MTNKSTKWIRPQIGQLAAYHVPDASGFLKLDAMENPYRWPEEMISEWCTLLRDVELNRYPDPAADELKTRLRSAFSIPDAAAILLGNGSDELIQMILMAVSGRDRVVLSVEPSFVMYRMIATFLDMQYVGVPLTEDFRLDKPAVLSAIHQHNPAVIFLAYPNNPTGNLFHEQDLLEIICATDAIVVIDEAYFAFADASFMLRVLEHDNLVVMRTVSKMGLAGLRLGYMAGPAELLNEFDKVRLPYNINVLTQASAQFALQHLDVLNQQTNQIKQDRAGLLAALAAIDGLKIFPSAANFILFETPTGQAERIFSVLKEHKVLIKNLHKPGTALADCLRVTVGTAEENQQFLAALQSAL